MLPRRFALVRHVDYTGVSGVGVVAYGVAFGDGHIALRWCSSHPATSIWTSMEDLLAVHGHGQATSVEWIDAPYGDLEDLPAPDAGRRARSRPEPKEDGGGSPDDGDAPPEEDHQGDARPAPDPAIHNGHPGSDSTPLLVGERSHTPGTEPQRDAAAPPPSRPGRHRRPDASR